MGGRGLVSGRWNFELEDKSEEIKTLVVGFHGMRGSTDVYCA